MVIPKAEEQNDEHRLMKKTRANWTLPSMTQQNPTQSSSINMPNLTPEELNLLKEVAQGPSFAEMQQQKKIRMVTHFQQRLSDKPPIPTNASRNKGKMGVKSSLMTGSEYRGGDSTPQNNLFKNAGDNIVKMRFGTKSRDIRTPD